MWQLFLHLSDSYLVAMAAWLLFLSLIPIGLIRLRRKWYQQKRRLNLVYAGLSAWFFLGLLTLPEIGFALLYDTTDSFDMTNVSRRWFSVHVEPDVRVLEFSNDEGIRYRADSDVTLHPPSGTRHICFLGDSFTFGHGVADVKDRFSDRVSRLMNDARPGEQRVVVSNVSWPGTDLLWAKAVLEHCFDKQASIDDAVYVLCLNDIEAFHDPTMSRSTNLSRFEPPGFLFRKTYFFNWLYFRVQLLSQSENRDYYSFVKDYYQGEPWRRFREVLAQTAERCRASDCRFRVAIFPFLHDSAGSDSFQEIHRQIVKDCGGLGIDCLDLGPALSAHQDEGLTVNPFDAHPNERAHEIAAEALEEWLARSTRDVTGRLLSPARSLERAPGD